MPDNDEGAMPRGLAIRFHFRENKHTDIIAHTGHFFPVRTGKELLEMFRVANTDDPQLYYDYTESHPTFKAWMDAAVCKQASFATHRYYGVSALCFVDDKGKKRPFRYQLLPVKENKEQFPESSFAQKSVNYCFDDVHKRLADKKSMDFYVVAQMVKEGDNLNDATVPWPLKGPDKRTLVLLGTVILEKLFERKELENRTRIVFNPFPNCKGIETTDDPLWELRATLYSITGKLRRDALDEAKQSFGVCCPFPTYAFSSS